MRAILFAAALLVIGLQVAPASDAAILEAYLRAVGGEAAIRAVSTRITTGTFDNGRGARMPFAIYEKAPNKRATLMVRQAIDAPGGSGRGYDGAAGWDKSFIGTGLRSVEGSELAELAQESDMLRSLHLTQECRSTRVDAGTGRPTALLCERTAAPPVSFHFDSSSGLLLRRETESRSGRVTVYFEDYRVVDALNLPFQTRIGGPGFAIKYLVDRIRHNEAIDDRVFVRPSS